MAKKINKKKTYKFTPAHEAFCQHYAEHGNATMAYLFAYPKVTYGTAKTEGCKLLTIPNIEERVTHLKEEFAVSIQQTKERTVEALISSAEEAKIAGQFAAYAKMRDMIIKMCGFYEPEKVQVETKIWNVGFDTSDDNKEEEDIEE